MLIKCYECGHDVSTTAEACAKCGAPHPRIIKCETCGSEKTSEDLACSKCAKEKAAIEKKERWNKEDVKDKKTGKSIQIISLIVIVSVCAFGLFKYINRQQGETYSGISTESESTTPSYDIENAPNEVGLGTEENKNIRANIYSYVTVTHTGNYRARVVGGIQGLKAELTNSTDYKLDRVYVGVDIFKANGEKYTTVNLTFYNVNPNSSYVQDVQETARGERFSMYVSRVESSDLGLNY